MNKPKQRSTLFFLTLALILGLGAAFTAQIGLANASEQTAPSAPDGVITIGDYVWFDANFNGEQDVLEEGIDGVQVKLYRDDGDGIFDPDVDQLYESTITGDDISTVPIEKGWYEFEDSFPIGNYWVYIPPQPAIDDWVLTSANSYHPNPAFVSMPAGAVGRDDIDFGYAEPILEVQKTVYIGNDNGASCPGQESVLAEIGADIVYCFQVMNTSPNGAVMNYISLDDADLGITELEMTLVPGMGAPPLASAESATYAYQTTMQGDLLNTVTASGVIVNPDNPQIPIPDLPQPTDDDTAEVERLLTPDIEIQKSVYLGDQGAAGCPGVETVTGEQGADVTYCFRVTNTGDTYLSGVKIQDPALGITDINGMDGSVGSLPLAPLDSILYYVKATIDGDLNNTAFVTATPVDENENPIPDATPPEDEDTANVDQIAPALEIQKTVYLGDQGAAGCPGQETVTGEEDDVVTYCFEVTNTGDTALASVEVSDPALGIDDVSDMDGSVGSLPLAPTDSILYYVKATIDGNLVNTAIATAIPVDENENPIPGVSPPEDDDTAEVEQVSPGVRLEKSIYLGNEDSGASCPGSETVAGLPGTGITYCFEVTNVGGTRLDFIKIDDQTLGVTLADMPPPIGTLPLEPNVSIIYYYTTTISGPLVNTAVVTATPVDDSGNPIPGVDLPTDEDTAEVEEVEPALEIAKSVYVGHNSGNSCPGDELVTVIHGTDVTYCFTVTNTGNTRIDEVKIDDVQLGINQDLMTLISGVEPLEVGASISYYYEAVTDGDLENTAAASATPVDKDGDPLPNVPDPTDEDTATVDEVTPAIEIQKTVYAGHSDGASCPGGEFVQGANGDDVTYCFTVTNSGDAYLDLVKIDDINLDIVHADLSVLSGSLPLAPGESIVYYYESAIDGNLVNTATVEATPTTPDGAVIPDAPKPNDEDTAEVNGLGPGIRIEKTVYLGHNNGGGCPGGESVVGGVNGAVTYCFEIVNTGNTYLDAISIVDPLLGITHNNMVRLSGTTPLAPGLSLVYYYETTITEALRNTATVTADPTDEQGAVIPGLDSPSDADIADVSLEPTGTIGDFVWNDLNANGIQDFGELGVPGVTVQLYDSDGNLVAETTTDVDGWYEFNDVPPGQYYIQFTPNDSYYFTEPYQGNDPGADSDANPVTGRTDFFIVEAGVNDPTRDAGLIQNPTLVLLKTANVAIAEAGGSITYVLSFTNDGPGPALDVVITEVVPLHTTFDADNSTPGWTCADESPAGTVCEFHYGSLAVGASGSVIFSVIVDLKLPDGVTSIYNMAVITDIPSEEEDDDEVDTPVNPPNAITLENFETSVVKENGHNAVQIEWVTSAEIDTLGFHLYRSTQSTPESSVRLTPSLISGQGNQGGAYLYTDNAVVTGVPYYYWLVELEIGGAENWHGPVSAVIHGADVVLDKTVFLPFVGK